MTGKDRKISIDVLMEGSGGELVFKEVKANRHDLKELIEASRNPVIKHNVFKAGSEKRIKV